MAATHPTLLQVRNRTRFFIDEPVQANFSDSDLTYAINAAQQEVATEISLVDENFFVVTTPTTITTVGGQRFYPLADDCQVITRLEDVSTGLRLEFSRFADQDNFYANNIPPLVAVNQAAFSIAIVGNSIALTPTPSVSGLAMQYWYVPVLPDLVLDTDASSIPPAFIDLLAIRAAIDAMIKDEDDTTALTQRYNQRFNQLVRSTRTRQQQNPRGVTRVSSLNTGLNV